MSTAYISEHVTYRAAARRGGLVRGLLYGVISLSGIVLFTYPLFASRQQAESAAQGGQGAHSTDATLATIGLIALLLVALSVELESRHANSRIIALLGVLVALDAALRVLPSISGFSPVFFLMLTVGYVYGAGIGFCMGALTLFVSALITGGVGPWLPYQMFAAGWVGLTAGAAGRLLRSRGQETLPTRVKGYEIIMLAVVGGAMGLAFGAIMDLWFWPFLSPDMAVPGLMGGGGSADAGSAWQPGLGANDTLARFGLFYVTTSLPHDIFRAVGNVLLVAVFGAPVIAILRRFERKFFTQWVA